MAATTRRSPTAPTQHYGLDVDDRAGRPAGSQRPLLLAGKIDFYMGGNLLRPSTPCSRTFRCVIVAAMFQKDPQVLMSHPGVRPRQVRRPAEGRPVHHRQGRRAQLLPVDEGRPTASSDGKREALHLQPGAVHRRQEVGPAGLCHLRAVRGREAGRLQAQPCSCSPTTASPPIRRRSRRTQDMSTSKPRRRAALRRCLDHRLVQLSLRRQQSRQRADQEGQSGHDRRADRLLDQADEGIRHRRFRRRARPRASAR